MKVGIMQPYLFPYIGYFQLINAVDTFVIYDDVAFIKGGWINRNRLKLKDAAHFFTVPLSDASPFRSIRETGVAAGPYEHFRKKFFATVTSCYDKSEFYREVKLILDEVFEPHPTTIALMSRRSIEVVCSYLGVSTRIVSSSTIYENSALKKADRLIDICRKEHADTYLNATGGKELYTKEEFSNAGITLRFLESLPIEYTQVGEGEFVPNLSIIDVLMNNSVDTIRQFLRQYELV